MAMKMAELAPGASLTGISGAGTSLALTIEYDGTNYHGSQLQANAPTIQGEIEKALQKLTGAKIRVKMASRTDAGVHARGQVVSFRTGSALPLTAFVAGLNHHLPPDIVVREACRVDEAFDVRHGALSREYRYYILNSPTRSPLRGHAYRVAGHLDTAAMNRACQYLIGRHDFASFITADNGRKSTVRNVQRAEVFQECDMIILDMVANAFLPHQVRNTAGSLIRVGQGKMTADEFNRLLEAKMPGLAGPTAPAAGLCLMRVNYPTKLGGNVS
jgi:tRNA pseudouridine38-40 synthase